MLLSKLSGSGGMAHARACQLFRPSKRARLGGHASYLAVRCSSSSTPAPHRVVFLGTPEVAAGVLRKLVQAASLPGASFEVAAVVTQPERRRGRGKRAALSPVAAAALELGFAPERVFSPASAKEEPFLDALAALRPALCVTAAYGCLLPQRFLDIPPHGTLNIHPSLLPAYRGAAPVPRALLASEKETGVSVAFTVLRMDAGPLLAQERVAIGPDATAPELLADLFARGTRLLLEHVESVWDGMARPRPQGEAGVSHAPKLSKDDGVLDFRDSAQRLHDQVRALAGWPGTTAALLLSPLRHPAGGSPGGEAPAPLELKVLETRRCVEPPTWLHRRDSPPGDGMGVTQPSGDRVAVGPDRSLWVRCGDGEWLHLTRVQPPNKKPMAAEAFVNGLAGRTLSLPEG